MIHLYLVLGGLRESGLSPLFLRTDNKFSLLRRGSMGCYVYTLNEVSAGEKAERVGRNFTPALNFHSGASAEERATKQLVEGAFVKRIYIKGTLSRNSRKT